MRSPDKETAVAHQAEPCSTLRRRKLRATLHTFILVTSLLYVAEQVTAAYVHPGTGLLPTFGKQSQQQPTSSAGAAQNGGDVRALEVGKPVERELKPPAQQQQTQQPARRQAGQSLGGWFAAGSHPQDYEIGIDTTTKYGGKAGAYIKLNSTSSPGFATLMQMINAGNYRGKRVRLAAHVKAEDIEEYAGLWMRVDGENKMLAFDNMHGRPIRGTSEWKKYEVVLDVPESSVNINFGINLRGKGEAWVDDFRFEVVGMDVGTTNMLPTEGKEFKRPQTESSYSYSLEPVNLDFEDEQGNRRFAAGRLLQVCSTLSLTGEKRKAIDYCTQALTLFREVGNKRGEIDAHSSIGLAHAVLSEYQKALDSLN